MTNSIPSAMQGYVAIYNALPVSIKSFISLVLFSFLVTIVYRIVWRIKG